jgi:hypothetical protein
MQMSPGLAWKISKEFYLDFDQLIKGDDSKPPLFAGQDIPFRTDYHFFSREEYASRREARWDVARDKVDKHVGQLGFALEVILDAANRSKRYGPFITALMKRLSLLAQEFELLQSIEHEILTHYTAGQLRDLTALTAVLFSGPQTPGLLENRDRIRPWLYRDDLKENKPSVPPIGGIPLVIETINMPLPKPRKQASPRSSPKGKSPRKPAPRVPQRDRDSAVEKPSSSRRARVAG